MTQEPTQRELELARRLEALEAQTARPSISGGGIVDNTLNSLMQKVPPWIVTWAVVAFLAFHGWQKANEAFQLHAETLKLQAEAAKAAAKLGAIKQDGGQGETLALESLRADIAKAEAARDSAKAEADAQSQIIDGATARVGTLQADIETVEQENRQIQATLAAYNQLVDGVPLVIAQKKAEVGKLEATANKLLASLRLQVNLANNQTNRPANVWDKMFDQEDRYLPK